MTRLHDRFFPEFAGRHQTLYELNELRRVDANAWLTQRIHDGNPFCVARFGGDELEVTQQWRRALTRSFFAGLLDGLASRGDIFFVMFRARQRLQKRGLAPLNSLNRDRFAGLMLDSMTEIDLLGSWVNGEAWFNEYMPNADFTRRELLEPFFQRAPWTLALEGKNVLVVHPFQDSIRKQYEKKDRLFGIASLLPAFTLTTHGPPRAHFGEIRDADHWFQLLEELTREVLEKDFDVALIGAGPFGLPLAAQVKRAGRQAVHLGGALQLLFGIRGRRWNQGPVSEFFNENWVFPSSEETPAGKYRRMSESSYWR